MPSQSFFFRRIDDLAINVAHPSKANRAGLAPTITDTIRYSPLCYKHNSFTFASSIVEQLPLAAHVYKDEHLNSVSVRNPLYMVPYQIRNRMISDSAFITPPFNSNKPN